MSNLLEGKVFVKISELDATTTFDTNDEFVLVRNGVTVKTAGIDFVDTVVSIGNLATKSYTDAAVAALVNSAPTALDTLSELSAALNNDADFASTITNQLSLKLNVGDFGLYFWNELNAITTYHVAEGANLYYTEERVDANFATKNTDALAEGLLNLYYTDTRVLDVVAPLLFSGDYNDLVNAPDLTIYQLASTAFSGDYNDLVNAPDLTVYQLASTAFSGDYNDLTNAPSLTTDTITEGANLYYTDARANLAFDTRLATKSTSNLAEGTNLYHTTARVRSAIGSGTNIEYNSSTGIVGVTATPTFTTVTTTNLNVQNVTFTGTGAVTISSGNDLNLSAAGDVTVNGEVLSDVAFSGAYADLTGKPTLFSGSYNDLTGKPTLFSGSYNDLTGKPTLATVATSGSYNDLTDKPTIPNLSDYATQLYVQEEIKRMSKPTDFITSRQVVLRDTDGTDNAATVTLNSNTEVVEIYNYEASDEFYLLWSWSSPIAQSSASIGSETPGVMVFRPGASTAPAELSRFIKVNGNTLYMKANESQIIMIYEWKY